MSYPLFIFIAAILFLGDFFSKYITPLYFETPFVLLPNILSLHYVQNPGIAFSFPLTGIALKIITCILIFSIFYYYRKHERAKKSLLLDTGYVLIFAGALGNAWERILQGYVTDMIALEHFAVFNLADSYISIGAVILIYYYFKNS